MSHHCSLIGCPEAVVRSVFETGGGGGGVLPYIVCGYCMCEGYMVFKWTVVVEIRPVPIVLAEC